MADETCPENIRLVQHLAQAINAKKRLEGNDEHSPEDRMRADESVNHAMEAIRAHKANHECQPQETNS
jgi:hypothetical protein